MNMINKILKDTDRGVTAVLATFVDWKDAFPNQCPKLGIEAFLKCGVRPSLIPILINYFQYRSVIVKWHDKKSKRRKIPGGGPQGAYLGNLEYLAQSNENANIVEKDSRYMFVDDLSALEKINLLLIGMASHNNKSQVPNDIMMNNQIIPSQNSKSQTYLDNISEWTRNQKMIINEDKTKCMSFNFTKTKQFSTRLTINGSIIETVKDIKLLGTIITDNLKWDKNTKFLIKKAYSRMELLRKMTHFTKSKEDKLHIYKTYIRSVIEQSCVVWNTRLSKKNERELERVQKVSVKLILGKYESYSQSLKELNIETLKERRDILCARFAEKCVKNDLTKPMFETNKTDHSMKLRNTEKYKTLNARTARMEMSAIPNMIKHLNKKHKENIMIHAKYSN